MRQALLLPILIATVLASFSILSRPVAPQEQTYITSDVARIQSARAYLLPIAEPAYAPIRDTMIAEPSIDARAALLIDASSGRVLYEKNSTHEVPIASLTKLIAAATAAELFSPQEVVTISSASLRVDGTKRTLYEGEQLSVDDLIHMMLIESSNDAAYALAAYARQQNIDYVERMNQLAARVPLNGCTFLDPAGLNDAATCSAQQLAKLVQYLLRNHKELLDITAVPSLKIISVDGRREHDLKTTNELLGGAEGVIGGKTGFTDGALGCLMSLVKLPNSDILISIVLGSHARFEDTRSVLRWATQAYRW